MLCSASAKLLDSATARRVAPLESEPGASSTAAPWDARLEPPTRTLSWTACLPATGGSSAGLGCVPEGLLASGPLLTSAAAAPLGIVSDEAARAGPGPAVVLVAAAGRTVREPDPPGAQLTPSPRYPEPDPDPSDIDSDSDPPTVSPDACNPSPRYPESSTRDSAAPSAPGRPTPVEKGPCPSDAPPRAAVPTAALQPAAAPAPRTHVPAPRTQTP